MKLSFVKGLQRTHFQEYLDWQLKYKKEVKIDFFNVDLNRLSEMRTCIENNESNYFYDFMNGKYYSGFCDNQLAVIIQFAYGHETFNATKVINGLYELKIFVSEKFRNKGVGSLALNESRVIAKRELNAITLFYIVHDKHDKMYKLILQTLNNKPPTVHNNHHYLFSDSLHDV